MQTLYRNISDQLTDIYGREEARTIAIMLLKDLFPDENDCELLLGHREEPSGYILSLVERLRKGEPIQYVLGKTEFFGMEVHVESGVLIPRPETEELIRQIMLRFESGDGPTAVLDVGTGSGCIALAMKKCFPQARVEAWDVSDDALRIAGRNAECLGLPIIYNKVDVLNNDELRLADYDLIVSNPPYVLEEERMAMERNVLDYEPETALFVPDDDPLLFYDRIADIAVGSLREGGLLAFEINRRFGHDIVEMLRGKGFSNVELVKDQFENDRFVFGSWKGRRKQ